MLGAVRPFDISVMIKSAVESPEGDWIVSGPVASLKEDYDGHVLAKAGVLNGLKTFFRLGGHVDYEHRYLETQDPDDIIGKAIDFKEVDGIPWIVVKLRKSVDLSKKVWRAVNDPDSPVPMGFSLIGHAVRRDPKNKNSIQDTCIRMMTISPLAKGFEQVRLHIGDATTPMALAKALVGEVSGELPSTAWRSVDYLDKAARAGIEHGGLQIGRNVYEWQPESASHETRHHKPDPITQHNPTRGIQVRCPKCRTKNLDWRDKCRSCGEPMPVRKSLTTGDFIVAAGDTGGAALRVQAMGTRSTGQSRCGKCGKKNLAGRKACRKCGEPTGGHAC